MLHRAIDLLHLAKQSDIEILLNEEQLQLKLPRNKRISEGLLKDIKDNKQLLIDFLTTHKKANKNYNKLVKFDRSALGRIPLSFSQERLLFIDRLEGSVQYHIPTVLRLKGKLNQAALEYALQTIVTRHEILRTVILEEEGNAYQHVKEPHGWEFSIIDGNNYKE
ncbi:MAG: condensation domain-containing protein, partial [Ferruginibacter sp.]